VVRSKCLNCGKVLPKYRTKFCSAECAYKFNYSNFKDRYKKNAARFRKKNPGKTKAYFDKWKNNNRDKFNEVCLRLNVARYRERKSAGLCVGCGKVLPKGGRFVNCDVCREKARLRYRKKK